MILTCKWRRDVFALARPRSESAQDGLGPLGRLQPTARHQELTGERRQGRVAQGALLGPNDFKKTGYGGPCPPIGRHRYFHKLYALDNTLDLKSATKAQIEGAMQGHVLANAELIGTYQKGDR
jgi:Raf kinase inhibitor-like YbhB/YbcL family protein